MRVKEGVSEEEARDAIRWCSSPRCGAHRKPTVSRRRRSRRSPGQQLADEQASDLKDNLSFFNTFLLVFAFIALFVGAFIIYNTFSITVAQRTASSA